LNKAVWKELHHNKLYQHQIKNSISNIFRDLLAHSLYTGQNEHHNITFHHLPQDIQALYDQQQWLSWKQLYYGRFLPQWIKVMQLHHPQINGVTYYLQCLTFIWTAVIKVWRLQNQHLHPHFYEQEDHSILKAAVHCIFQEAQQDPNLQAMIENLEPEQILSQPTRQVHKWVTRSNNHIQAHHKAAQLCAKLQMQDIQQFLPQIPQPPSSNTADKNLLHPPQQIIYYQLCGS